MRRSIFGATAPLALLVLLVASGEASAAAPVGPDLSGAVTQVEGVAAGAGATVDRLGAGVGQVATGTAQQVTERTPAPGTDSVDRVVPRVDLPTGGRPAAGTVADPGATAPPEAAPPPGTARPAPPSPAPHAGGPPAGPRHRASGTAADLVRAVRETSDTSTASLPTRHAAGPTAAARDRADASAPGGSSLGGPSSAAGGGAESPASGFSGTGPAILLAALFLAASGLSTRVRPSRVSRLPAPLVFALERPG